MKTTTFILATPKTWKREVRVFVLNKDKKFEQRLVPFETKGVIAKLRTTRGRVTPATYTTADPELIDALRRDSAYGKQFHIKGDIDGEMKLPTLIVSEKDKEIVALRGLCKNVGLQIDESLPIEVLKKQYEIHVMALAGTKNVAGESTASEIPLQKVDVRADINQAIADARQAYVEKYGEEVPDIVYNDLGFLTAIATDPKFDAAAYISSLEDETAEETKETDDSSDPNEEGSEFPAQMDELRALYFTEVGSNVPNPKKNQRAWIIEKIKEVRENKE